ncbi:hypothetical protein ABZ942_20385 [Nocardia sp. NPDC046473]|uniref:hypothetical protein n=1 Tax=Nocardia sp. NPDC046473 TaxID=3155733 RepID=UPI003403A99F
MRELLPFAVAVGNADFRSLRDHAHTDDQPAPDRIGVAADDLISNPHPDNSFHIEATNGNHPLNHPDIAAPPLHILPPDNSPALQPANNNTADNSHNPDPNRSDPHSPNANHLDPPNANHIAVRAPHPTALNCCPQKRAPKPTTAADSQRTGSARLGARNGGADHVCGPGVDQPVSAETNSRPTHQRSTNDAPTARPQPGESNGTSVNVSS